MLDLKEVEIYYEGYPKKFLKCVDMHWNQNKFLLSFVFVFVFSLSVIVKYSYS